MLKVIVLLKRKPGLSWEEFDRYWEERHGPLAAKLVPGTRRYVQNHIVRQPGDPEPLYDGIAELWLDDMEAWKRLLEWSAGEEGRPVGEDEAKFLDRSQFVIFLCDEKVMKG